VSPDIVIFALIAAFLIHRLRSVLGTRNDNDKQQSNPFADNDKVVPINKDQQSDYNGQNQDAYAPPPKPDSVPTLDDLEPFKDDIADSDTVRQGLLDIASEDARFDVHGFLGGARSAFEYIVYAYAQNDLKILKELLSPSLYKDFAQGVKERKKSGNSLEIEIHRITSAKIIDARLGGSMAYVTIDFDVEETSTTKDKKGNVIDGDPESITEVIDIWTFAKDIRSTDPNWMLIETRTEDK